MSQKELKQPDAFQKAGVEASGWMQSHGKLVVALLAVALVGGAGVAVASYVGGRAEQKAAMALSSVLDSLDKPVSSTDSTSGSFKSETERLEATVKALTEFRSRYPQSRSALTAGFLVGQAFFRLNKWSEAATEFEAFLRSAPVDEPLRSQALEAKGYLFEAQGKLDEALMAFDTLARENKAEFMNGMGAYHRSRVLILQGKKEEAAKLLSTLPAMAPNSPAARLATERMAVLTAQGVVVPPPALPATPDAG